MKSVVFAFSIFFMVSAHAADVSEKEQLMQAKCNLFVSTQQIKALRNQRDVLWQGFNYAVASAATSTPLEEKKVTEIMVNATTEQSIELRWAMILDCKDPDTMSATAAMYDALTSDPSAVQK